MQFTTRGLPRKGLLFFVIFLARLVSAEAQNTLKPAWDAFLNNDRAGAKVKFTQALSSPAKSDALLGLALVCEYDASQGNAFSYFKQFYAQQPAPAPYLYALWSTPVLNQGIKKTPDALAFFNQLAQRQDLDGSLVAMANGTISKHYEESLQGQEAVKYTAKMGTISQWQITGEFENISSSGFDKTYETLAKPQADAVFTSKYGAPVKWFTPPFARRDKWFDYAYYFDFSNSVLFAQTFVNSAAEQEVQLRVGVSGSVKTWLNDQLVIAEAEECNNDLDTYIRKVKLHKGYNRILVQIGESTAGNSNFMVRITDEKGVPVSGLSAAASYQPYTKEHTYKVTTIPNFAEAFFEKQVAQSPDDPLNYLLLAKTYMRSDKVYETRHILEKIRKKYPNSTYLNTLMIELFARNDDRTGQETTREDVKTSDPEYPLSLNLFYDNAVEKKNYTDAELYAGKLEKLFGGDEESVLEKKLSIAGFNKKQDELIKVAEYAYGKHPENKTFVTYKYLIEKEVRKNNQEAISVIKKYLAHNEDWELTSTLAQIYFDTGDAPSGLKLYSDAIARDPVSVGLYSKLSRIYYQLQNYAKAEEYVNKAIQIAPYISGYHSQLAAIYNAQDKKENAIAEYHTSLSLSPNDYSAIRELRKLEGKKDVQDYFGKTDALQLVKAAPPASAYPEDNVLILNESVQTVIYPSGGSEEKHSMLARILNSKGLEKWKEYGADVSGWQSYIIETAEVIKSNGTKVPAEVNETEMVFTNLEIGDCINVVYKVYNYSKGKLASKFWSTFYFSHGYPYLNTSYSVLVAKNQPFSYQFSQKEIVPVKTSVDEFDLYTWKQENQPGLLYEDKMPPMKDVANVLHLTTIPAWSYVANWYNDLASAKAKPAYEVKEAVAGLLDGKKGLTDRQKAEMIYNYITRNITYSSVSFRQSGLVPQNPATVLNTRIGDCKDVSTLFVSMCKEAGVSAQLVLVNTRDNGIRSMILPSIDFNHCIAKLALDGKDYYLELTSNYLPFSSIGGGSINSITLDIDNKPTGSALKLLAPLTRKQNVVERKTAIKVDNEDLLVSETNFKVAAATTYTREKYLELSPKDRLKQMQDGIRSTYPSAEVSKLEFKNLENTDHRDTVFTSIDYNIKGDVKKIGGIMIVTLPWSNKALASDFTVTAPRAFPLDLSQLYSNDTESEVISLQVPEGKNVIENLEPVTLSNEFIDYKISLKQVGKVITYSRNFKIKKDLVPADQVMAFNDFYKKIIAADNKQVALR
ncbi:transglutaminase domain-containing protein [Hufsiella ginkgonis]|uniref:Tetratricopeptide repeat protein n=1 Tax=Hufsiella ginkgonis TaxID=2695274 RepID=A0A7K1Y1G1_9SPHI|nr:transglutaminase domain-containing protein [Hufsiella ginkgonis]MXV17061.1 tetratricopeptide repeat protein [Hufsiella ginkgonis]